MNETRSLVLDLHLYEDSKWKEDCLSKLEIILDDGRNDAGDIGDLGDFMEYGKSYRISIHIEPIEGF